MPLLAFVWATLPWLPCCQIAAVHAGAGHESTILAALNTEAITTHDSEHCPDSGSETSTPVCTDVVKNGNEARPTTQSTSSIALGAFAYVVSPVLAVTDTAPPILEPPRPLPRRSLHLQKSVLLI